MENEIKSQEKEESFSSLVERMEKANAEHKELIAKQEELSRRAILGGVSEIGKQEEPKKEITPSEYASSISKGIIPK